MQSSAYAAHSSSDHTNVESAPHNNLQTQQQTTDHDSNSIRSILWPAAILDPDHINLYLDQNKKGSDDEERKMSLLKNMPSAGMTSTTPFEDSGYIELFNQSQSESCVRRRKRKVPANLTGGHDVLRFYRLSAEKLKSIEAILWSLMKNFDESMVTFIQLAYPLTSLFLHFLDEEISHKILSHMIMNSSQENNLVAAKASLSLSPSRSSSINYHQRLASVSSNNNSSNGTSDRRRHFSVTRRQFLKDVYVFIKLTSIVTSDSKSTAYYIPSIFSSKSNHMEIVLNQLEQIRVQMDQKREINYLMMDWLKWIFCYLPFEYVIRIMDNFLMDGIKFLFRSGLIILKTYMNQDKKRTKLKISSKSKNDSSLISTETMIEFCSTDLPTLLSPQEFIDECYSIKNFSSDKLSKLYHKAESDFRKYDLQVSQGSQATTPTDSDQTGCKKAMMMILLPFSDEFLSMHDVIISNRMAPFELVSSSSVLDYLSWDQLYEWLPESVTVKSASVIFSSEKDGSSLSTFFSKCDSYDQTVILIKTEDQEVFGSFCSESWSKRFSSNTSYFGTGETFVFSLTTDRIECFRWNDDLVIGTEGNRSSSSGMFMSGDIQSGLRIGSSILFINSNLSEGISGSNDVTFKNHHSLTISESDYFKILTIEVIGFEWFQQ